MRFCSNLFSMIENGESINPVLLNASSARLDPHALWYVMETTSPHTGSLILNRFGRSEYITQTPARTDPYNPERYA